MASRKETFMNLQAIVMCGGLGSRLRPWSWIIPKPLFPIGDRAILELLLERLKLHGITEIYLSLGYKAELIKAVLGDGAQLGVSLHYVLEEEPLGTAGAINLLRDRLRGPFLMMNGDLVTHLDFGKLYDFHMARGAEITVGTKAYEVQIPYGVIESAEGRIIALREKPVQTSYINTGIYLISPSALDLLPLNGHVNATDLIESAMQANRPVYSYLIEEYWADIGRIEDYFQANADVERLMNMKGSNGEK